MESTTGNLVHLEEYVDTIVSLPHEIQRNLTMIREHDSRVQDMEKDLFKDVDEFMTLQSGKKEISGEERVELIKRIKNSFLSTLTHCEEKVSLANQCYNSVEKHLVKMEEDLKCFEEEIRLSGYSDLLEKVRIERRKQKEQVRNKKRQESYCDESEEDDERDNDSKEQHESSSEKEQQQQQQQQQQKKRKPANRNASNPKKQRASAVEAKKNTKPEATADSDEEAQMLKISRAERLLRRNKPNYVAGKESDEHAKEDDNQGDDEAESELEGVEGEGASEGDGDDMAEDGGEDNESEVNEDNNTEHEEFEEKEDPSSEPPKAIQNLLTVNARARSTTSSEEDSNSNSAINSTRPSRRSSKPSNSAEQVYCTCNRVSFGEMIGCDAKDCPVEWFHYECVGLKSPPKGKWYCKGCQEAMDAKTAAQLAVGISTRSSRRS